MQRANSSESELDDFLVLHAQSHDNFENEMFIEHKIDLVNNTVDEGEQQRSLQSKGITKTCESAVITRSNKSKKKSKSRRKHGRSKSKKIPPKQKSNKVDKSREKKIVPLLEDISSDDNIAMDSEEEAALDSDDSTEYNNTVTYFDPSLYHATPLEIIQDPSLSIFEHNRRKLSGDSKCKEASELVDCLEYLLSNNEEINERWIIKAQQIVVILPKTLHHILNISEYCNKLFSLMNLTLDLNLILKRLTSNPELRNRCLKIGLQLIEALCQYNEDLSEHLIKHHKIHNKLINLYFTNHMSWSLKFKILRSLDSSLNGFEPIRLFSIPGIFKNLNGYDILLEISITEKKIFRVCFLATSIVRKIQFYELLPKLNVNLNILNHQSELLLEKQWAEITFSFNKAPILMGCPKRFVQAHAQFELTPALIEFDVYPTIYRLFDHLSLLKCMTKLLNSPNISKCLEQNILKLLQSLMDCDHGLRYLGYRHRELNKLLEVLTEVNTQFKSTLVYKLKVLSLIDYLSKFWEYNLKRNFEIDQMICIDILHDMFILTLSEMGQHAVVSVLTMADNLEIIFKFFKYMDESRSMDHDLHIMYAMDLMKIVLENSEDVNYLKKYGPLLYELAHKHSCFNDLISWTIPVMKQSAFDHDNVNELCKIVKNNIDNCLNYNNTLITSLRVLKYLGVTTDGRTINYIEYFVELKYKYAILQMYSYDMLENVLMIFDKICDNYKYPSIDVWKLTGNKAKNIIYIIRPSMVLIKSIITIIIQNKEIAFKDLSPIKILLKLYDLMHHIPYCSPIREDATNITKNIIEILELYVKIDIGSSMAYELIAWTLSSPSVFISGLLIFCKLLPSPLPIKTKKPLEVSAIATIKSLRNTWIDHLGKVSNELVELITILSSSKLLLKPLECLFIKISDLSMSLCLLVTQALFKALIDSDNNSCFNNYLDLLTKLCTNKNCATIKTVVLQILNAETPQGNYKKFVQKICHNIKANKQKNHFLFLQGLCDSEIIICGSNHDENLPRNSIPNKWVFNNILKSLLSLFESHTPLSTMSLAIKTCMVIIKNDYGFYQFKTVLDLFPKAFYNICNGLVQKWKNENNQCVNTLTYTVQLLNLCIKNDINTKRRIFLSSFQLRECLNWSIDIKHHPIHLLKKFIQLNYTDCCKDLTSLIDFLNNNHEPKVEVIEPQLSAVDYLTPTFEDRLFYVVDIYDNTYDDCSKDFCSKGYGDLVNCNIKEIASSIPDFNIEDKINDLFKIKDCVVQPKTTVHKPQESIITDKYEIETTTNTSTLTTTSTNQRVFCNTGIIQRPDTSCHRFTPSSSRLQSMQVDDFVAMETKTAWQQQPHRHRYIQPIQDQNIIQRGRKIANECRFIKSE